MKLHQNEKIIATVHVHWFTIVVKTLGFIMLGLLPLAAYKILGSLLEIQPGEITLIGSFLYTLWTLVLWVMYFFLWTDYHLDRWVITTQRIIDIEHKGMFHREVANLRYEAIQDISIDTIGVFSTLLGRGDIYVQTAGTEKEFIFYGAQDPERVKDIIAQQQNTM